MTQEDSDRRLLCVTSIPATSPSLAETMRICMLRAGLSKAAGAAEWVLGNPKAWLGTAYHALLEEVARIALATEECAAPDLDKLWDDAIRRLYQRAKAHPLDHRFGEPATWPGYYLAWANMRQRATRLLANKSAALPHADAVPLPAQAERSFSAFGGKLAGRPDLVIGDQIFDYKTGDIFESEFGAQSVVKAAYVRQLRIYGHLVREALGKLPSRGILLPAEGEPVEVDLDPRSCEHEARQAVALLDSYNEKVRAAAVPEILASPSPENCCWCPYKVFCPSFWAGVNESWSGRRDGEAVQGVLAEAPKPLKGGRCVSMSVAVDGGTQSHALVEVAPVNTDFHPVATTFSSGERVRIAGLTRHEDGRTFPGARTVLFRYSDLPIITVNSQ